LTVLLFSTADKTNEIIDLLKDRDNLKTKEWSDWDDPVFRDDIHQSSLHLCNVLQEARFLRPVIWHELSASPELGPS
jgi:hypothetical protein